ncbi:mutS protein homolog 5-like [Lycorma delicatula]|uniref:mutS protein homolog 5-like n=1 Tax=Lycorma delicatula TaxID=130591 RepID=UPI003F513644
MTNGCTSVTQWKSFYKTVYYAVLIGEICRDIAEKVPFFSKITAHLCDSLYVMGHCIYRIVDFDDSFAENRFCVRSGICENLDKLKEEYNRLPSMLSQLMEREVEDVPLCAETYYMIYLPEVGYMLAVSEWKEQMFDDEIKRIPGLNLRFMANGVAYFKTACCYELDQLIGDVWVKIIEQESKIMLHLLNYIKKNIQPLLSILEPIIELDCLIAFSKVAMEFNYVRPEVVESDTQLLEIVGGRHPLQELLTSSFIANDTYSSPNTGLIRILTGPNCSGKSIYLKQVALITYLAHIGSYVPADKAKINVIDQIHTRIQTTESVASQLSAFLIDLRQITLSIYNSSNRSLVIIDEFGKGTAESDGLAILAGCLKHFITRGSNSPHLFVSTHFHLLTQLLPASPIVSYEYPDYILENGELIYLYKLKSGSVKSSLAIQFASNNGLSSSASCQANKIYEIIKQTRSSDSNYQKKRKEIVKKAADILRTVSVTNLQNRECLKEVIEKIMKLKRDDTEGQS